MPKSDTHKPIAVIDSRHFVAWPSGRTNGASSQIAVRLELDGTAIRLVRAIEYDGEAVAETQAWCLKCENEEKAVDAYEALTSRQVDFGYWSVGALALGRDWLDPTINSFVTEFIEARDEKRARLARELEKERVRLEEERTAETRIDVYFREKKGRYLLVLERGTNEAQPIWSIAFEESWERDRFWDWLGWRTDRFEEFSEFMRDGCRLELERMLLREMLVTEQAVKKQGLGSGGRRPLRFWRGEL